MQIVQTLNVSMYELYQLQITSFIRLILQYGKLFNSTIDTNARKAPFSIFF